MRYFSVCYAGIHEASGQVILAMQGRAFLESRGWLNDDGMMHWYETVDEYSREVGAWVIVHVERMSGLRLQKKGGLADIWGLVALAVCQQRYLSADPNIECGALLFQRSVDDWYCNLQLHRSSLLLLPFSSQYIGVRRDELPRVSRASCRPLWHYLLKPKAITLTS